MPQSTQTYRRSLAGSVGAGMKSVFGGSGRRFYTLVHKVSSKYHTLPSQVRRIIRYGQPPPCGHSQGRRQLETHPTLADQLHLSQRPQGPERMVSSERRRNSALHKRTETRIHHTRRQERTCQQYQPDCPSQSVPPAGSASV